MSLCTVLLAGSAAAQDAEDGGLVVGFTFSELLEHDDGTDRARSDFGLTLRSQTRSQSLSFGIGAGLEKSLSDGLQGDVEDPRLTLGYTLQNRSTALSFDLAYRRSDIDDLTVTDPLDVTALIVEDGEREDGSAALTLEFGRESPFGATLGLGYSETGYIGITAATLLDSTNIRGDLTFRFDVAPTATLFTSFSVSELDRDGGTDTRREAGSASLEMTISEEVTATADLGYARVITDGTVPRRVRDGLFYGLSIVAERPNGSISGLLNSDITENGRRSTFRLNRQFELPSGALNAGIGASRNSEINKTDPLYSLGYVHTLPRGQLSAGFSQIFSTSTTGIEALDSRFSVNLAQSLTPLSNLNAGFSYRDSDQRGAGGIDSNQLDISLTYSHTLTETWELFGGVSHTRREQDGAASSTDDRIFIGLRTALEWRP